MAAADWAAHEAQLRNLPLRLVTAWEWQAPAFAPATGLGVPVPPRDLQRASAQQLLAQARSRVAEASPEVPIAIDEIPGLPVPALLKAAEEAELLVLGSRGLGQDGGIPARLRLPGRPRHVRAAGRPRPCCRTWSSRCGANSPTSCDRGRTGIPPWRSTPRPRSVAPGATWSMPPTTPPSWWWGRRSALPVIDAGNRVAGVVSEAELLRKEEFRDSDQDVHPGEDLCGSGDDTQGAPERRRRPPDGSAGATSCAPDSSLRRHPRRARGRQAPTSAVMRSSQWTVRSHQRSSSLWS
ncbi:universal stress protein [Streptomyces nigra]|uniref:universal stress protein n=1 Tax=Streptomyces nigra TaxID=1827580 RepID=UPI00343D7F50